MIKQLHIYPTSRALRELSSKYKEGNTLLPTLMRMDEFEKRAILLKDSIEIDKLQRILLLREAANFTEFKNLKLELSLVKFFTKSDAIFKFFEELASENVNFTTLAEADAYAEFASHLEILEKLLLNYKQLLDKNGYIDKAFIPNSYILNNDFLKNFNNIEIHLEGYLSRFELELLEAISSQTELVIHYATSRFNLKMQDRFGSLGISMPNDSMVSLDMRKREILTVQSNTAQIDAKVYVVKERQEQIAVAFVEIEQMVSSGIAPEDIVLILPDEEFKEQFILFDTHNNLNFAMGHNYSRKRGYKSLEALYGYWQRYDEQSRYLLGRYGFDIERIDEFGATHRCGVGGFFEVLHRLEMIDFAYVCEQAHSATESKSQSHNEQVHERYMHFSQIFDSRELSLKEWLFLWLKTLSKIEWIKLEQYLD
jgi:inactivated superfamily I helicase